MNLRLNVIFHQQVLHPLQSAKASVEISKVTQNIWGKLILNLKENCTNYIVYLGKKYSSWKSWHMIYYKHLTDMFTFWLLSPLWQGGEAVELDPVLIKSCIKPQLDIGKGF